MYKSKSVRKLLFVIGLVPVFYACNEDTLTQMEPVQSTNEIDKVPTASESDYICNRPVYISSMVFSNDMNKRKDLNQSFPQSSSAYGAAMCVYDASEVFSQSIAIKAAFERGAIIAVANPTEEAVLQLKKINESAGALTVFSLQGVDMVAYDKSGHNYELIKAKSSSASQLDFLEAEATDSDEEGGNVVSRTHHSSFTEFARWLDSINYDKLNMTRSSDFGNYSSNIEIDTNAQQIYVDFEVVMEPTQFHRVSVTSKPDVLEERRTHIVFNYSMNPVHVFNTDSSQGTDYAGDYYIFQGNTVARNAQCFDIYKKKHGVPEVKARGWFMTGMRTIFTLLNPEGKAAAPKIYGDNNPLPQTTVGSTTYSETTSFGFNANIGAMRIGGQNGGLASVGFSGTWSKELSTTVPDVTTRLNSTEAVVNYKFEINNIGFNKDNDIKAKGIPLVSYNDLSINCVWCWQVPQKDNPAAKDNSDSNFKLKIDVEADYSLQHYQTAKCMPGVKTYSYKNSTSRDLKIPERRPFGVLQVKNLRLNEAVGHVKVWKQDAYGNKVGDPVLESSDGACQRELIQDKLFAGTYIVEYETFNNNGRTGIWQVKGVVIKLGATEGLSRTLITTAKGTKIG